LHVTTYKERSNAPFWLPDSYRVSVSVIVPSYNRVSLLQKTVASVISQTFTDWELIIVDDGSTDDTVDVIQSMNDPRISVLTVPHCGNIAMLRNTGAQHSSGEWIAFLDSDDIWLPGKLEIQLNDIKKQNKRWGYTGFELMNEKEEAIPLINGSYKPLSGNVIMPLLRYEASITVISLLIQRAFFEEIGGLNSDLPSILPYDYELTLRLALYEEAAAVPDTLVRIREHSGRVTRLYKNSSERSILVFKHFMSLCNDKALEKIARKQYAYYLAEAGVINISAKKYIRGITQLLRASLTDSSSIFKIIKKIREHNKLNRS
jgi:glycosyltransferase involved in cell wall biosynthesis